MSTNPSDVSARLRAYRPPSSVMGGPREHHPICDEAADLLDAQSKLLAEREWRLIDDGAPRDGTQFLAALSNGWVIVMSEIPNNERYAWYRTPSHMPGIPVVRTHRGLVEPGALIATHWQPLPKPPIPTEGNDDV